MSKIVSFYQLSSPHVSPADVGNWHAWQNQKYVTVLSHLQNVFMVNICLFADKYLWYYFMFIKPVKSLDIHGWCGNWLISISLWLIRCWLLASNINKILGHCLWINYKNSLSFSNIHTLLLFLVDLIHIFTFVWLLLLWDVCLMTNRQ